MMNFEMSLQLNAIKQHFNASESQMREIKALYIESNKFNKNAQHFNSLFMNSFRFSGQVFVPYMASYLREDFRFDSDQGLDYSSQLGVMANLALAFFVGSVLPILFYFLLAAAVSPYQPKMLVDYKKYTPSNVDDYIRQLKKVRQSMINQFDFAKESYIRRGVMTGLVTTYHLKNNISLFKSLLTVLSMELAEYSLRPFFHP
jgi:hypothetical protein